MPRITNNKEIRRSPSTCSEDTLEDKGVRLDGENGTGTPPEAPLTFAAESITLCGEKGTGRPPEAPLTFAVENVTYRRKLNTAATPGALESKSGLVATSTVTASSNTEVLPDIEKHPIFQTIIPDLIHLRNTSKDTASQREYARNIGTEYVTLKQTYAANNTALDTLSFTYAKELRPCQIKAEELVRKAAVHSKKIKERSCLSIFDNHNDQKAMKYDLKDAETIVGRDSFQDILEHSNLNHRH